MNYEEIWPGLDDAPWWAILDHWTKKGCLERIADTPDGRSQYRITAKGFAELTPDEQEEFGPEATIVPPKEVLH